MDCLCHIIVTKFPPENNENFPRKSTPEISQDPLRRVKNRDNDSFSGCVWAKLLGHEHNLEISP